MKFLLVLLILFLSITIWLIGMFSLKIRNKVLFFSKSNTRRYLSFIYLFLVPFIFVVILPASYIVIKKINSIFETEVIEIYKTDKGLGYKKNSKILTSAVFEEAQMFNGSYAIVKKNGLYGLIDKNGKNKLKYEYDDIKFLTKNLLYVIDQKSNKFIYSLDIDSKVVENIKQVLFVNHEYETITVKQHEKSFPYYKLSILYTPNNNVCEWTGIATMEYLDKHHFSYITHHNKESGIFNFFDCTKSDIKIIEKNYRNITKKFKNGIIRTIYREAELYGVMDANGSKLLEAKYNEINFDSNEYPLIYAYHSAKDKNGVKMQYGEIYDINGKKIINKYFDYIFGSDSSRSLNNGTLAVQDINGKYGLIDVNGSILLPFIYNQIYSLEREGFYIALGAISKTASSFLFTKDAKVVLEKCDAIYSYQNGLIKYKKDAKVGLVDFEGNSIVDNIYDDVLIDKNLYIVKNNKWGTITKLQKSIIEDKYDFIGFYNQSLAVYKDENYWGFITLTGEEVFRVKADFLGSINKDGESIVIINNKKIKVISKGNNFEVQY